MDWSRIGTAPGEEQQEAEGTAEEGAGKGAVGAGKGCTVTTADLWGKEVPSHLSSHPSPTAASHWLIDWTVRDQPSGHRAG